MEKKGLKVLMLNYEYPPLGGGASIATENILKEFSKIKDLDVDLVTSSVSDFQIKKLFPNITIHFLNIGKKGDIQYQSNKDLITYSRKSYFYCKKLIKKQNYDLVHAFFGIPCGYIAMKLGLPFIVSLRGSDVPFYNKRFYWLDKIFFKRLSRSIWKRAKAVITNSEGLKILAMESSPKQGIGVIYNGVDTDAFKPNANSNSVFTVISSSRLIKRKGIEYLIDAFTSFNKKYSNSKLYIVGSGNLENKLCQIVKEKNMQSNVEFTGPLDHDKIACYYKKSDVFVLPSLNEGMSNSLLEAIASGLAVVVTDTGGTKELVNTDNGIIVRKENSIDILNALEKLYLDNTLLNRMKLVNREKAMKMSVGNMAQEYLKTYHKILCAV